MGTESQMRRMAGQRKNKSSPPILSQEFIIQNHGDIMSCVVMVIFAGFMFQVTAPLANLFLMPQYNVTVEEPPREDGTEGLSRTFYRNGLKDVAGVFFYTCCWVVVHAIIQDYVMDRLQRKLHLSKTRTSKFTESGHLALFCLYSVAHAAHLINTEHYLPEVSSLWAGYPEEHRDMSVSFKLFFIFQISYWIHQFPEFYFQKVKKDEIKARSTYTLLYLFSISVAYALNFTRVALCVLFLHYIAELVFHVCRMAHFAEKKNLTGSGFTLFNFLFVLVRLGCVALSFLTFWYGLRSSEVPAVEPAEGNFNTTFIRLNCLLCSCGLQVYLMWNFINFHLRRMRAEGGSGGSGGGRSGSSSYALRSKQRKEKKRAAEADISSLPEADQEHTRVLRSAKKSQ